MQFYTIGVYSSTEDEFFNKLINNKVDTFCDIRQRRGVRGSKYAFVNSNRLQVKLKELGIAYLYISELAPTTDIRNHQKKVDQELGELKRERQELGKIFTTEYKNQITGKFNFDNFILRLDTLSSKRIALFCVEEKPQACHRSLVSDKLQKEYNYKITHL